MKKRVAVFILAALLAGCASTQETRATGDSSASREKGDITTTTTTLPDGTVTVVKVCTQCEVDESVANPGSTNFYKAATEIFLGVVGVALLVVQILI